MQPVGGGPIKIGHTKDLVLRKKALESQYGCKLTVLATMDGGFAEEQEIHKRFADARFDLTEQFRPTVELMIFIGKTLPESVNPNHIKAMPQMRSFGIRACDEWKAWLQSLATFRRKEMTDVVDEALEHYSAKHKFTKPPKR